MKLVFTGLYQRLTTVLKTSKTTLKNVVVILLVFGLEQLFEKGVFNCPASDNHRVYGVLFIIGPAVCLFNLTLLLHSHFWDIVTGCRHAHFSRRWVCKNVARIVFQALLPAGVWIVTALVQTQYYVCAKLGPKEEALRMAVNSTVKQQIETEYIKARAESQILAWVLFNSLVVLGTLAVCVRRCCFLRAEGSMPTMYDYEKIEAEVAVVKFKERMEEEAAKEAEHYVNGVFDKFQGKDGFCKMFGVRRELVEKYPRSTGDLSKPYRQGGVTCEVDGSPRRQHEKLLANGHQEQMIPLEVLEERKDLLSGSSDTQQE